MTRAATAEPAPRKSGKSVSFRVKGGSKGGEEGDNEDPTMVRVDDGFDDDSLPSDEEGGGEEGGGDFSVDNNRFNRSASAPEQWEERAAR